MKLPRNLDGWVESGRQNLDGVVDGGRRGAERLYKGSRHWIEEHLPEPREVRRSAERGRDRVRRAADDDRLRAPVRWIEARLPETRSTTSVLWPSVLAAAGAGVAFWWWTSWSRGRAEAAEREAMDAAGGAAGKAHPEQVMAHAAEPAGAPIDAPDSSAAKLSAPAEQVMAHSPPPAEASADGVTATAPAAAVKALDESLAVQGVAPKANGQGRAGGAPA